VRPRAPDAERIVDKMPLNFCFVGLISPGAAERPLHKRAP